MAPFLIVGLGGAALTFVLRFRMRTSTAVGLGCLALAFAASLAIHAGDTITVGDGTLVATDYTRLVAILGSATALLLGFVSVVTGWQPSLPPAALGTIGAVTVALAAPRPETGVLATLSAGLVGGLVTAANASGGRTPSSVRALRAIVIAGTFALVAVLLVDDPIGAFEVDPAVLGIAYVGAAIAVAVRFAAIPFHVWAGRLADAAPEIALPLVLAWTPAALAVVLLTWTDSSISPLLAPLDAERGLVVAIGAITILLGAFAAWVHEDIEHVVTYSIAQDAGFVLLAFGALDPIAWEPARTWVIVLALGKTAFAAWVIALRVAFDSRRVGELRGWAPAAPLLAVSLAGIAAATVGWPGSAAWSARGELIRAAISDPLGIVVTLGGLSSLLVYGRLLAVGVAAPSGAVRAGAPWRPRLPEQPEPIAGGAAGGTTRAGGPRPVARPYPAWPSPRRSWLDRASGGGALVQVNRVPITAALVLILSAIAVTGAAGGFGLPDAARAAAPTVTDVLHPLDVPGLSSGQPGASPAGPEPSASPAASASPGVTP